MREHCQTGQVIDDRYRILKRIGTGATSAVFLATHIRAGGLWAVKEIRPDARVGHEIARNSLNAEIEILKKLSHPLLPRIVDVAEDEERFYVIMEYFEGRSLEELMMIGGAPDPDKVLEIGTALCDVLSYLHAQKPPVIYRDLKPANIILQNDGQIRLIDFGSAVRYGDSETMQVCDGTRAYAAPEQLEGFYDERSDIYCLGRTLYHLCTGNVPVGKTLTVPDRELNRIIRKCTMEDPGRRYASCGEVVFDLWKAQLIESGIMRRVKIKAGVFCATLLMMCVCAGLGLYLRGVQARRTLDAYTYHMEQALASVDSARQLQAFRSALQVDPSREEAYLELLERVYLQDSVYTQEEDASFLELLMTRDADGRRYEEVLAAGSDGMDRLHFSLGLAYFYCYEGNGNKVMAYPHLCAAAESRHLAEEQRRMAGILSGISSYYTTLGRGDKSGDAVTGYRTYWEDLEQILAYGLPAGENDLTTMMICQEVLHQLHMNACRFKAAGVTREQMERAAEQIGETLASDTRLVAGVGEEEMIELRSDLMETLTLASQTLRAVFPERESDTVMQAAARVEP